MKQIKQFDGWSGDVCANHHKGNGESIEAHKRTSKARGRLRILQHLRTVKDSTCDEAEKRLGMSHQTCSARFSDLKREGKIEPTTKRKTRSGSTAMAWRIKSAN